MVKLSKVRVSKVEDSNHSRAVSCGDNPLTPLYLGELLITLPYISGLLSHGGEEKMGITLVNCRKVYLSIHGESDSWALSRLDQKSATEGGFPQKAQVFPRKRAVFHRWALFRG